MIAAPRISFELLPDRTNETRDGLRALACDITGRAFLWPAGDPVPVLRYRHEGDRAVEGTSEIPGHNALVIDPELAERGPEAVWDALRDCIRRHRVNAADELSRANSLERLLGEPWETLTAN